jgi:PHD/YefM family antitoxin component YafN of YafNO toxin-antitoxin module
MMGGFNYIIVETTTLLEYFSLYSDLAQDQPVLIAGQDKLRRVLISAEEYERLKREEQRRSLDGIEVVGPV